MKREWLCLVLIQAMLNKGGIDVIIFRVGLILIHSIWLIILLIVRAIATTISAFLDSLSEILQISLYVIMGTNIAKGILLIITILATDAPDKFYSIVKILVTYGGGSMLLAIIGTKVVECIMFVLIMVSILMYEDSADEKASGISIAEKTTLGINKILSQKIKKQIDAIGGKMSETY